MTQWRQMQVFLTARGRVYAGGLFDQQESYLRQVLDFIGIADVTLILG